MEKRNEDKIERLTVENKKLRDKLRRVRDWISFAANSKNGIVHEIDWFMKSELKEVGHDQK